MPLINVRKRKHELRARFKRFRAECPPELKKSLDKRLFERFASLEEYRAADVLFAYISQPIECDTSAIIADALEKGKRVAARQIRHFGACARAVRKGGGFFVRAVSGTRAQL